VIFERRVRAAVSIIKSEGRQASEKRSVCEQAAEIDCGFNPLLPLEPRWSMSTLQRFSTWIGRREQMLCYRGLGQSPNASG